MDESIRALLRPESIALIGASANPEKLSNIALRNLVGGRFRIYPVNPKEAEILGMRCYPRVCDVPESVDLAVISLPAANVVDPVVDCVKAGVKVVIISSSGFGETGPEGAALEAEVMDIIRGSGTRVLGPNTMGVLVPETGLDTFFISRTRSPRPGPGHVALISQSGAVSVAFLEKARLAGVGISASIGLGNRSDIDESELMRYLASYESTRCIALYLESFKDGRSFMQAAREISPTRPLVALKSGRTPSGSRAAESHTGSLASISDGPVDGALRQAGVVRAYDEEDLLDVAKALARVDHIEGDRICVVASAGGFGVIAADLVEASDHGMDMSMAVLSDETQRALKAVTPPFSSVRNPVDLTSGVTNEMYDSVLEVIQRDDGVDCIMMSLELQPPNVTDGLIEVAKNRSSRGRTPIVVSAFGGERTDEVLRILESNGIAAYPTIRRALRAISALAERGAFLRNLNR
ncbi:MAG: CoA-binding protein [Thermoplasmata archaeon]|nr:CoA-binding protein [Thermoplasmata archaeon]